MITVLGVRRMDGPFQAIDLGILVQIMLHICLGSLDNVLSFQLFFSHHEYEVWNCLML